MPQVSAPLTHMLFSGTPEPDPHCVNRALNAMGAAPDSALMIGDTPSDLYAAEAAGVPFVGYARNERKRKVLREAGATTILPSLKPAARPLRLGNVPGEREIESALFRWLASRGDRGRGGRSVIVAALNWEGDRRLDPPDDFPESAVREALAVEGAAPAGRVFKGTAHLNTVVRVPGSTRPVVVRRRLPEACRRERSFLSEHAVLRAIEEVPVAVAVPRALALGVSHPDDPFAIHTYEGPGDVDRRPDHPVDGLLPHEADGLVDQLCALTLVDFKQLDPLAGERGFHRWLKDQLVTLVAELPRSSQLLARHLGLPDAARLRQILSRHEVSHRKPSLLHGDLNPWNLVRRDDAFALTLIDWEMALVGDPLYDLVRHMHLTPTRPEIRERMFRRWERGLPSEYTRDWRKDWQVYRWLEIVRSAYVDLDRIVTGASLDAPTSGARWTSTRSPWPSPPASSACPSAPPPTRTWRAP